MKKPTATIQSSAVCEELLVMWEAGLRSPRDEESLLKTSPSRDM
jgi:hypothetical protein